jgi:hypothetical protein
MSIGVVRAEARIHSTARAGAIYGTRVTTFPSHRPGVGVFSHNPRLGPGEAPSDGIRRAKLHLRPLVRSFVRELARS